MTTQSLTEFRVLVCGGRDYDDRERLFHVLDLVRQATSRPIVVIEGEQRGADLLAREWAEDRGCEVRAFPADWKTYGKKAGFLRNTQMLQEGDPHVVIAFPGGTGTNMMKDIARRAGVPVKEIS